MRLSTLFGAAVVVAFVATACDCGGTPPVDEDGGPGGGGSAGGGDGGGSGGGTGGGVGGGSGGGGGSNPSCNVNPCGVCPSSCTDTSACDQSSGVWSCTCACSDGGVIDGGQTTTDGGVSPGSVCLDVARRECDYMIRCKADSVGGYDFRTNIPSQRDQNNQPTSPSRGDNIQIASGERDTCVKWLANEIGCQLYSVSWDAGRATLDQTGYFDCINANYPPNSCEKDIALVFQKCVGVPYLRGLVPNNGSCSYDRECATGWCSGNPATCGTCQAYLATTGNVTCLRDDQCDPATTYCAESTQSPNPCKPYIADGGACGTNNPYVEGCAPGLVCSGPNTGKVCKPPRLLGETCVRDQGECKRDARTANLAENICNNQADGGGVCVPLQSAIDGPCGNGDVLAVLATFPFVIRGPFCQDTQYCNGGLCTNRRSATQPCQGDTECQLGLHCVNNFCAAYTTQGGTCANNSTCQSLLACQGTTCQSQYGTAGEACNTNVPCVPEESFCSSNVCTSRLDAGVACNNALQCKSYVCNTTCQDACWD